MCLRGEGAGASGYHGKAWPPIRTVAEDWYPERNISFRQGWTSVAYFWYCVYWPDLPPASSGRQRMNSVCWRQVLQSSTRHKAVPAFVEGQLCRYNK